MVGLIRLQLSNDLDSQRMNELFQQRLSRVYGIVEHEYRGGRVA